VAVQGVAVATGLQAKFDWAGVASAGLSSAAIGAVRLPGVGGRVLSGVAGSVAGGAARSLVDGSSFGDNVLAALPGVIGQTIGELVAGALGSTGGGLRTGDPRQRGVQLASLQDRVVPPGQPDVLSDHGAAPPGQGVCYGLVGGPVTCNGPVWRGPDGRYGIRPDGSTYAYYEQNSLALTISFAKAVSDRHQAHLAHAYRQIAIHGNSPGVLAYAAQRRAAVARGNAAVASVDLQFALLIPSLATIGAAPASIGAGTLTTALSFDAAGGAARGLLTGNYRTLLMEGGNRLTGTGANGLGVGDVVVGAANLYNLARGLLGRGSSAAAGSAAAQSEGVPTTPNSTVGWKVGDPINNLTSRGNVPSWSAVRSRFWKNEAHVNFATYNAQNRARMERGLAPQRFNPVTGKVESMELHHVPPQRLGGLFDVQKVWPDQHAAVDPFRRLKK